MMNAKCWIRNRMSCRGFQFVKKNFKIDGSVTCDVFNSAVKKQMTFSYKRCEYKKNYRKKVNWNRVQKMKIKRQVVKQFFFSGTWLITSYRAISVPVYMIHKNDEYYLRWIPNYYRTFINTNIIMTIEINEFYFRKNNEKNKDSETH